MKKIHDLLFILVLLFSMFIVGSVNAEGVELRSYSSFSDNLNEDRQGNLNYTVRSGDTLWLIAESVYGKGLGKHWILIFNSNDISRLPNGYPLIEPGQVLMIPDVPGPILTKDEFLPVKSSSEFASPEPILVPDLALEHMIDNGNFSDEIKHDGIRLSGSALIGPYDPGRGIYAPMDSFIKNADQEGYTYRPNGCGYALPTVLSEKQIDKFHISECVSSSFSKSNALKVKDENRQGTDEGFFVIKDQELIGSYFFADQLVYNPTANELSFRASRGNNWLVVTNRNEKIYDYVETIFYTTDGTFYIVAKDGADWIFEKNGKIIERAEYVDNFMYLDDAKNIAYRVHETGDWFYMIRGVKQQTWNYVDKLSYSKEINTVFYRARDDQGNWFFVKVDPSNKSFVIYQGLAKAGELTGIIINPIKKNDFIGEYKLNGQELLIADANDAIRGYELVGIPIFSNDGNHFCYIGYQQISRAGSITDMVVDNLYIKKICADSRCSLDLPEYASASFTKNSNAIIIYTYNTDNSNFTRTEYSLNSY